MPTKLTNTGRHQDIREALPLAVGHYALAEGQEAIAAQELLEFVH